MPTKNHILNVRVYSEDKENFTQKCNQYGVTISEKLRVLIRRVLNTESISSFMMHPRIMRKGLSINPNNRECVLHVRLHQKEYDEFFEICRQSGYKPSVVARNIIQDYCDDII